MKIIVFSDSHGDKETMRLFLEKLRPETALYLGDGIDDIRALEKEYPALRFEYIKGNCDTAADDAPKEKLVSLDGFNFYLTHGDRYKNKLETEKITACAREKGASLFLHGHTHTPTLWTDRGVTVMNPGTVRDNPDKRYKGYATCGLIQTYGSYFTCKVLFAAFLAFYERDTG
ncbi:MAG: YfcE family phosphodiesterase [Firmicutes bacterium]|nr:YfcE family phosphodiesterase [Bacillota bacterium]